VLGLTFDPMRVEADSLRLELSTSARGARRFKARTPPSAVRGRTLEAHVRALDMRDRTFVRAVWSASVRKRRRLCSTSNKKPARLRS